MMTDPIADMLTRIRNAAVVHKKEVAFPFSKIKLAIANILVQEGYLAKAEEVKAAPKTIVVTLKYEGGDAAIHSIKRISTPGHRKYVKKDEIDRVLNGLGVLIMSTPRGIITGEEAKKSNTGGEVLCEVY